MSQQFTANYFFGTNIQTNNEVRQATLIDSDLVRGNTAGEIVTETGSTRAIFDGFIGFIPSDPVRLTDFERRFDDGEVSMTVRFDDGTSQSGVLGIVDFLSTGPFGEFTAAYLFDQQALASVGKTVADVESVFSFTYVDHDLSWADLGFTATGITVPAPQPEPEPEPKPALNLVQGTAGNDTLIGTSGDDLIRGGDGNDRLTGGAGADTFVFGADARDGNRDRDVITDFNAAEDTIVFEAGAMIRFIEERKGNLIIHLEGDRDTITVLNADREIEANFVFTDDIFLG